MDPLELAELMRRLQEGARKRAEYEASFEGQYQRFMASGGFEQACRSEQEQRLEAQRKG